MNKFSCSHKCKSPIVCQRNQNLPQQFIINLFMPNIHRWHFQLNLVPKLPIHKHIKNLSDLIFIYRRNFIVMWDKKSKMWNSSYILQMLFATCPFTLWILCLKINFCFLPLFLHIIHMCNCSHRHTVKLSI